MKLIRYIVAAVALCAAYACTKFDDSAIWQAINKNAADIAALRETTKNLNSDIIALQQLVVALQNRDYITNCTPLADGTGYTVAFNSGKSIVVRNGQNGADGKDGKDGRDGTTPQIGIKKYSDGLYYWTLNGEWLLGSDGNMIRAEGRDGKDGADGKDGITPQIKIEDECWYVSTDNGVTWANLGKATGADGKDGDSFFKDIIVDEESVTFVLSDGTKIVLPLVLEGDIIHVFSISLSKTSVTLVEGSFETITATITPPDASNQNVLWSSSDTDISTVDMNGLITAVNSGIATITVKSQDGGHTATCTVTVIPASPFEPEAVDLGLPSGLKWASCNLGATKPEEYGGYYQWGGLQDVKSTSIYLDWSGTYPYHIDNSGLNIGWTKYIPSDRSSYWSGTGSPDNKTVLDPEDDVAHVKLGSNWRMPTIEELEELIDNCNSASTILSGVRGWQFTSKKNGRSIFLPEAGYRGGGYFAEVNSYGYYWSSSLDTEHPSWAHFICFRDDYNVDYGAPSCVFTDSRARYLGLSIRPVSE